METLLGFVLFFVFLVGVRMIGGRDVDAMRHDGNPAPPPIYRSRWDR